MEQTDVISLLIGKSDDFSGITIEREIGLVKTNIENPSEILIQQKY